MKLKSTMLVLIFTAACVGPSPALRALDAAPRAKDRPEATKQTTTETVTELQRRYQANPAAYPDLTAWLETGKRQEGMPHMDEWWARIEDVRDLDGFARALGWIAAHSGEAAGLELVATRGAAEVVLTRGWTTYDTGPISHGLAAEALRARGYADLQPELERWEARYSSAPLTPQTVVPGRRPGGFPILALLDGYDVHGKAQDGALTFTPGVLPLLTELGQNPRLARAWLTSIASWAAKRKPDDQKEVWNRGARMLPWYAQDVFAVVHPELPELAARAERIREDVVRHLATMVPERCRPSLEGFHVEYGHGKNYEHRPLPVGLPYDVTWAQALAELRRGDLASMPGPWRTTTEQRLWGTRFWEAIDEGIHHDNKGHPGAGTLYITDLVLVLMGGGPRSRLYGGLGITFGHEYTHRLQYSGCLEKDPAIVRRFSGRPVVDGDGKQIGLTDGERTWREDQADVYGTRAALAALGKELDPAEFLAARRFNLSGGPPNELSLQDEHTPWPVRVAITEELLRERAKGVTP